MELNNINCNPIVDRWEKRYLSLTHEKKQKIDELDTKDPKEYQLRVIKRSRNELKEGDVFVLSPRENVFFYGKILKTNIKHIKGDSFVDGKNLVFIFQSKTNKLSIEDFKPDYDKLLISPVIVDLSYWTKGLFYTVGNVEISEHEKNLDYGFYKIDSIYSGYFCKEDGSILRDSPRHLGTYGITTIIGVAGDIEQELIINPDLLKF